MLSPTGHLHGLVGGRYISSACGCPDPQYVRRHNSCTRHVPSVCYFAWVTSHGSRRMGRSVSLPPTVTLARKKRNQSKTVKQSKQQRAWVCRQRPALGRHYLDVGLPMTPIHRGGRVRRSGLRLHLPLRLCVHVRTGVEISKKKSLKFAHTDTDTFLLNLYTTGTEWADYSDTYTSVCVFR
jgi:hypothetical protein